MGLNDFLYYWFKFTVIMLPLGLFVTMLMYEMVMEYVVWLKLQIEPPIENTYDWTWDFKRFPKSFYEKEPLVTYFALVMLSSDVSLISDNGDYVRLFPKDIASPDRDKSTKAYVATYPRTMSDTTNGDDGTK